MHFNDHAHLIDSSDIKTGLQVLPPEYLYNKSHHRAVYVLPDEPGTVYKIVNSNISQVQKKLIFFTNVKPYLNPNINEYLSYKKLYRCGAYTHKPAYFAKIYGWQKTDQGWALLCEHLKSDNGEKPVMLRPMLSNKDEVWIYPEKREIYLSLIREFYDYSIRQNILSFSWRPENIGFITQDGHTRLVSVDIKTQINREFIPVSTYIPIVRRRKITRRIEKYWSYIQENL